jgi:hypothetical protein
MYKIIGADQKEYGPITADQVRQWIFEGRINAQTKVWTEGSGVWKAVGELPEFAAILPASSAPPAPGAPATIAMAPPGPKTSQLAVWAMITGILSMLCCFIPIGPIPIILGAVALPQIKNNPQMQGSGFAIAGIVMGILALLVFIAWVVAAFSFPQYFQNFPNSLQNQ